MSHIHTLRRVSKKKDLFMCADSMCTWTRRKEFLVGKKFLCPQCGNPYLVNNEMLKRKFPHCDDCTVSQKKLSDRIKANGFILDPTGGIMSEKGRYDNLHGDEPEIEAARMKKKDQIREDKENHCEDSRNEDDPWAEYVGE